MSFKRRVPTQTIPGTRPSPYNSLPLLSTGVTSIDDLVGGGIPLHSTVLVRADTTTDYALLLLKFWIAQAVVCKQEVVLVGSGSGEMNGLHGLVNSLMGVDGVDGVMGKEDADSEGESEKDEELKIAFRYKGMKQHVLTRESLLLPYGIVQRTESSV